MTTNNNLHDDQNASTPQGDGDQIEVGDIRNATGVAVGAGARATVYQGLSTEEVAELVVELKRIDQPLVWNGRFPYVGLKAFQESDAAFFFGREELVDDLLQRVQEANFIVIAGPSGQRQVLVGQGRSLPCPKTGAHRTQRKLGAGHDVA